MLAFGQRLIFGGNKHAAQLAFRSDFVPRLSEQTLSPDDANWAQFWLVFDSASDVATLLPIVVVRSILASHPENIATLIRILCGHLYDLVHDPEFPTTAPASLPTSPTVNGSPRPGFLSRSATSMTAAAAAPTPRAPDLAREALNCIRVLSRVFPCLFERAGLGPPASGSLLRDGDRPPDRPRDELALEPDKFEDDLLWTKERKRKVLPAVNGGESHFVIDDDEDDHEVEGGRGTHAPASPAKDEWIELPSLGERLMNLVIDMLFVAGFTLPEDVLQAQRDHHRVTYVIWEEGIGATTSTRPTADQESNRIEVMRLLLVLLSRSMYVPPPPEEATVAAAPASVVTNGDTASSSSAFFSALPPNANRFLQLLRAWHVRRVALSLLCSLLNTAITSSSSLTSPTAVQSISNAAASVPLVGGVIGNRLPTGLTSPVAGLLGRATNEARKELGLLSFLVLDIVLSDTSPNDDNVFRHYVAKLHRAADLTFLATGLVDMLVAAADANTAVEHKSGEPSAGVVEGLVMLWRLMDINPKFLATLLNTDSLPPRIICALVLICLDQKDDSSSLGLVRLCTFVLQALSSERAFGARLNVSLDSVGVRGASRGKWAVPGTVFDFLIVSIYVLVFSTKGGLSSLYHSFTSILVNCSPYFKRISVVASTRCLQLFLAFSAPTFLLAEDDNPRLCYNMLEIYNNVINHQLSDNPNLIYAIIRSHQRFEDLASFTLQTAVADIRKARAERAERLEREALPAIKSTLSSASLNSSTASLHSPSALDMADDPFPRRSEKARGKMRESAIDGGDDMDPGFPGPYTSRTGFTPTAAWVSSWREALPLEPILVMLAELRPKVESLCSVASASTNQAVFDFLRSATLLGLLPAVSPLKPRRFAMTSHASRWLLSVVWAAAYMRQSNVFGGTRVALFSVQAATGGPPRDAVTEAMSHIASNVAGVLQRRTSSGSSIPRHNSLSMSQRNVAPARGRANSTTV